MKRAILFFLLFTLVHSSTNIFCKEINELFSDITPTLIDNPIYIQGINQSRHLISYINRFESTSHGDYRYSYIIYDYKNNIILENLKKMWIAQQYYDEITIENWNDQKYSAETYKEIIRETIDSSYKKYNLVDFKLIGTEIETFQVILKKRERLSRWTENINYELRFVFKNNQYILDEVLSESDILKNIVKLTVYDTDNYLLIIQKSAYDYFEDDDYYIYTLRGIKK